MGPILYLISNKVSKPDLEAIRHKLSITPLSALVVLNPSDIPLAYELAGSLFLKQEPEEKILAELRQVALQCGQAVGLMSDYPVDLTAIYEDGRVEKVC